MQIATTNDGNVAGYSETAIQDSIHCSHSDCVIETKHPVRCRLKSQKAFHAFDSLLFGFDVAFWS